MKWKELSPKLLGALIKKDIQAADNSILIKKNSILTTNIISYLLNNNIKKVPVSFLKLDNELLLQLERFIIKSKQPLFWEEYIHAIEETKVFFTLLEEGAIENFEPLLLTIHNLIALLEDEKEFFEFAYSIEGCSDSLYRHSVNVSIVSFLLGNLHTLIENNTLLSQMGYIHDIGKVKLDKNILNKPQSLTTEEKFHIQAHTLLGERLLKSIGVYKKELLDSALLHHESLKGDGYPNKIPKESIPIHVQVISTADVFDTLCSDRVYKKRNSMFESLNKLYFDSIDGILNPIIVFPWIEHMYEMYLNEYVVLSDGSIGKIYYLNPKDIIRPIIELDNDTFLDLSQQRDLYVVDYYKN